MSHSKTLRIKRGLCTCLGIIIARYVETVVTRGATRAGGAARMSTAAPRACAHMGRGSNNTRRMLAAAAALVCTVLVIAAPARAEAVCEEVQGDWRGISAAPMSSQHPRYVHVCRGVKGWRAVPFLWAPLRVSINCSSSSVRRCCCGCVPWGRGQTAVCASASSVLCSRYKGHTCMVAQARLPRFFHAVFCPYCA